MPIETEQAREDKALKLAYERGRREAVVDGRINSHEDRLNALNGNLQRFAKANEELAREVQRLGVKMDTAEKVARAVASHTSSARGRWRWLFETAVAGSAATAVIVEAVHYL